MAPFIKGSEDDLACTGDYPPIMSCSVPIKPPAQEDPRSESVFIEGEASKSQDPFLWYSDNETRMRTLGVIRSDDAETKSRQETRQQRKTCISFEVHPSLVLDNELEDIFDGLSLNDDDDCDLDLEFDNAETDLSTVTPADLLRVLLEM